VRSLPLPLAIGITHYLKTLSAALAWKVSYKASEGFKAGDEYWIAFISLSIGQDVDGCPDSISSL
jgi:hypothetical protein